MRESGILLSAFEPSGDELASALIRELRFRLPDRPIYALGGPRMRQAGAELIECTTDNAVMGLDILGRVAWHRRIMGRLGSWMRSERLSAVIPTDSPAANWSVCELARRYQTESRIYHLAAPQLWAWGQWRIGKLRRLTDHVLCLLPFEPEWFRRRGVLASFVGHPLLDHRTEKGVDSVMLPAAEGIRLALLPGSRDREVNSNWPTILEAYEELRSRHHDLQAVAAASDARRGELMLSHCKGGRLPEGITLQVHQADATLSWADIAVIVSGTATLQSTVIGTPMVVMYNVKRLQWNLLGRWLIRTRTFALPNLIARYCGMGEVVPELVPNLSGAGPLIAALEPLIEEPSKRQRQREQLNRICERFRDVQFTRAACDIIAGDLGGSVSSG